jgi:hypothetical protein
MGRIEVPLDPGQQLAALQRQVAEQGRRTIPSATLRSQYSTGIVAYRTRAAGSIGSLAGGTDRAVIGVSATVTPGRLYQVSGRVGAWVDGAGDSLTYATIYHTIDGTAPIASGSPILRQITHLVGQNGSVREAVVDVLFPCPPTCTTLRCLLAVYGFPGRTYGVYSSTSGGIWTPTLWVTDQGIPAGTGVDY